MPLKNKPTITAFITRKDNKQNGLEITEIEFLLSQDRLILQEKHLFYRERAKFILTNCSIDSDTVLDNTPTFIDSIEELWETSTEEQLKNIQVTVDRLIDIINKKLRERKTKTSANTKKK